MNCEQCRELLVGYLYEELDDRQRKELEAALRDCPECQAELTELMSTAQLYRHLPDVEVPARVHQNILREARLHADVLREAAKPWYSGWLIPSLSLGAAAAAVLLGLRILGPAQAPQLDVSPTMDVASSSRVPEAVAEYPAAAEASPEAAQVPLPPDEQEAPAAQPIDQMAELQPQEEAAEAGAMLNEQRYMDNVSPPQRELRQRSAVAETGAAAGDPDGAMGLQGGIGRGGGGLEAPSTGAALGRAESSGAAGARQQQMAPPPVGSAWDDAPAVPPPAVAAPAAPAAAPAPVAPTAVAAAPVVTGTSGAASAAEDAEVAAAERAAPARTAAAAPSAAPSYGQPARAPAPGYGQPAPAPSPGYGQPAPAPSPGYGQPAPAPGYGQPYGTATPYSVNAYGQPASPAYGASAETLSNDENEAYASGSGRSRDRERQNRPRRDNQSAEAAPSQAPGVEDAITGPLVDLDSNVRDSSAGAAPAAEPSVNQPSPAEPQSVPVPPLPPLIALVEGGQHQAALADFAQLVAAQPSAVNYYWYVRAAVGSGDRALAQRLLDTMRRDYPGDDFTGRAEALVNPPAATEPPANMDRPSGF